MKFSAGITLFNPSKKQIDRVFDLACCFDIIYLFDNTDNENISHFFDECDKIHYYSIQKNMGLSYAFNHILKQASADGIDFVCTLDQDSLFEEKDINLLKDKIERVIDIRSVGIVAPYIDYGDTDYKLVDELVQKKWVITSGSFVNLKLVLANNIYYDDNYFIDKFEIDFCENVIKHGFSILMYCGSVLHQELGERGKYKNHPNHNPLRHYYLFRNRYYFNKKWFRFPKRVVLNFLQTCKHLSQIILYENMKKDKIKMLSRARRDYKKGRMGKMTW